MPGADLDVLITVLVHVIKVASVIAVIAGFGILKQRELSVTGDASQPAGMLAFRTIMVLVRKLICTASNCFDWMDSMIGLRRFRDCLRFERLDIIGISGRNYRDLRTEFRRKQV